MPAESEVEIQVRITSSMDKELDELVAKQHALGRTHVTRASLLRQAVSQLLEGFRHSPSFEVTPIKKV